MNVRHSSRRSNFQDGPFSTSFAHSTSLLAHNLSLATKVARVDRSVPFCSIFASIPAREGAYLHSLWTGALYDDHSQLSSPIGGTNYDGFQLFVQKRGTAFTTAYSRCAQTKSKPNISTSNGKHFKAGSLANYRVPSQPFQIHRPL